MKKIFFYLGFAALLLGYLNPNHFQPWLTIQSEVLAYVFMFILLAVFLVAAKNIEINIYVAGLSLLIILNLVVQLVFSVYSFKSDVVFVALYLTGFLFSVIFGQNIKNIRPAFQTEFLIFLSLCGFACSLLAIYQTLIIPADNLNLWSSSFYPPLRASSNLSQPNHFGIVASTGIASLCCLEKKGTISRGFFLFSAIFLSLCCGASVSKASMLAVVAISLFYLVLSDNKKKGFVFLINIPVFLFSALYYFRKLKNTGF